MAEKVRVPMKPVRSIDPAGATRTGEWTDAGLKFGGATYNLEGVCVLPPTEPSKIVCIGRNYVPYARERNADIPDRSLLFLKPLNTLQHMATKLRCSPTEAASNTKQNWFVIGEQCKNVDEMKQWMPLQGINA